MAISVVDLFKLLDVYLVFRLFKLTENWLLEKTADPAGLLFNADMSPPNAPNAPAMALNRALPLVSFML
jgi:hypothetical protein